MNLGFIFLSTFLRNPVDLNGASSLIWIWNSPQKLLLLLFYLVMLHKVFFHTYNSVLQTFGSTCLNCTPGNLCTYICRHFSRQYKNVLTIKSFGGLGLEQESRHQGLEEEEEDADH